MKRQAIDDNTTSANTPSTPETIVVLSKKQKKTSDTNTKHSIPIVRGKFKQRWLAKHSSLIKRSDSASGVMITCGIHAETRALVKKRLLDSKSCQLTFLFVKQGQAQQALERHLASFPSYESTWTRMEGPWDVEDLKTVDQTNTENDKLEEDDNDNTKAENGNDSDGDSDNTKVGNDSTGISRKDRTFQAVDAACGGMIFYRFRVNIKPTDFIDKMIDRLVAATASTTNNDDTKTKEQSLIRHCSRWIPLDYIMQATTDRIDACFTNRILPENIVDLPTTATVAIVSEIRNNTTISKQDLIAIIAPKLPTHLK
jgi:hypothetical protein